MTPHSAFDVILRETLAEMDAAAVIDDADARAAQDEVEQLRLHAAQLVAATVGGPWLTGAPVQFAQDPATGGVPTPTVDIRFPAPRPPEQAPAVEAAGAAGPATDRPGRLPQRQGRRTPQTRQARR